MKKEKYINIVENDDSNEIARFILTIDGNIISCNNYACKIFKYNNLTEVKLRHFRELVPDEFAENLPEQISIHHLTNGVYLERVNKCKDNTLISTLVLTKYIHLENSCYIETHVKLNKSIKDPTREHHYKQISELLKCELENIKNQKGDNNLWLNNAIKCKLNTYQLNSKEIEFCSLLISGLQTKEIASFLNLTIESTYKLRKRIRKKLRLEPHIDLRCFLNQL